MPKGTVDRWWKLTPMLLKSRRSKRRRNKMARELAKPIYHPKTIPDKRKKLLEQIKKNEAKE